MKYSIIILSGFLIISLFTGCDTKSESGEISSESSELMSTNSVIDSLELRVKELEKKNRLLVSNQNVNHIEGDVSKRDVASLREMVLDLKAALNNLNEYKDPDKVLQYFLPSFSTNQVSFGVDNTALIAHYTSYDYRAFLKKKMREKGIRTEMGKFIFLDLEIKKDIFNITFKNRVKVFKDEKLIINRIMLNTLSGRMHEGWKIGNYSFVSIDYEVE